MQLKDCLPQTFVQHLKLVFFITNICFDWQWNKCLKLVLEFSRDTHRVDFNDKCLEAQRTKGIFSTSRVISTAGKKTSSRENFRYPGGEVIKAYFNDKMSGSSGSI